MLSIILLATILHGQTLRKLFQNTFKPAVLTSTNIYTRTWDTFLLRFLTTSLGRQTNEQTDDNNSWPKRKCMLTYTKGMGSSRMESNFPSVFVSYRHANNSDSMQPASRSKAIVFYHTTSMGGWMWCWWFFHGTTLRLRTYMRSLKLQIHITVLPGNRKQAILRALWSTFFFSRLFPLFLRRCWTNVGASISVLTRGWHP